MLNQKNDLNDKPSEEDLELAASIARGLTPTASAEERTNALLLAGFSVEELSLALGVSENTVRNWAEGSAQPRRPVERALDDLRTVMVALDEAGIRAGRAVNWLRSRNRAWLGNERPLDVLADDPLLVFAAAENPEPQDRPVHKPVRRLRPVERP